MKPIPGFPGYFADKWGNIWSTRRYSEPRKLKSRMRGDYLAICLYKNKKRYWRSVHLFILETFIGPCPKGHWARHKDGVGINNKSSNLKWDTRSNNMKDKIRHGTDAKGEKSGLSKLTNEDVIEIRRLLDSKEITRTDLGKLYNVSGRCIGLIDARERWSHI